MNRIIANVTTADVVETHHFKTADRNHASSVSIMSPSNTALAVLLAITFNVQWTWCSALRSFPQCCAYPVESFLFREFSGPCCCQTLQQKWRRFVDWVEMEGGFVHPDIELNYLSEFDRDSVSSSKLPSHEKGVFVNIHSPKNKTAIPRNELLFQIPFSITFSPLIISKYIASNQWRRTLNESMLEIVDSLFPKPEAKEAMMPDVECFVDVLHSALFTVELIDDDAQ